MSGGYLSGGICPVGICPVGICPDTGPPVENQCARQIYRYNFCNSDEEEYFKTKVCNCGQQGEIVRPAERRDLRSASAD